MPDITESMTLVINRTTGKFRSVIENGISYLVCPVTMIIGNSVMNGSDGPLFYPMEQISKSVSIWNGIPIVLDHPADASGKPISASSPGVIDTFGIGQVRNASALNKLAAEAWLAEHRLRKVAPNILTAIKAGKAIEVSTGLFSDKVPGVANAAHNGIPYKGIATNYRADHLAVLTQGVGACAVRHGCGLMVNRTHDGSELGQQQQLNRQQQQNQQQSRGVIVPDSNPLPTPSAKKSIWNRLGELFGITTNEPSFGDIRSRLSMLLKERFTPASSKSTMNSYDGPYCYVENIYQEYVVYELGGRKYKIGYSVDGTTDEVTLTNGLPTEVIEVTSYQPIGNADSTNPINSVVGQPLPDGTAAAPNPALVSNETLTPVEGNDLMSVKLNDSQKKQIVTNLVTNCNCSVNVPWKGKDETTLNTLSDDTLAAYEEMRSALVPVANGSDEHVDAYGNRHVFNKATRTFTTYPAPIQNNQNLGNNGNGSNQNQGTHNTQGNQGNQQIPVQTVNGIPVATPVAGNSVGRPKNIQEWMSIAPPEAQATLNQMVEEQQRTKAELIERLVANVSSEAREQAVGIYSGMEVSQLRILASALPATQQTQETQNAPVANFFGNSPAIKLAITEEPLMPPTYNFSLANVTNKNRNARATQTA